MSARNGQVQLTQVQREPLDRLVRYLGGNITGPYLHPSNTRRYVSQPIYHWQACGAAALGIVMTLYSQFSPRRKEQARVFLAASVPRARRHRWHKQLALEAT